MKPQPAQLQESQRNVTTSSFLNFAYRNEDWTALYGAKEFSSCATSSVGYSAYSKNFSNFGADCFGAKTQNFFAKNDVNLASNPKSLGRPSFKWNSTNPDELVQPLPERLARRTAETVAQENSVLKSVVTGSFSFSLDTYSVADESSTTAQQDTKPKYVLFVTETRVKKENLSPVLMASSEPGSAGLLTASAASDYEVVQKRELREVWSLPSNETNADKAFDGWERDPLAAQSEANTKTAPQPKKRPISVQIQRQMGLGLVPFSKAQVKVSRSPINGKENLGLRFSEGNEIVFYQLGSMLGQADSSYGIRVPVQEHAVAVVYTKKIAAPKENKPVITYTWVTQPLLKIEASYDVNQDKYSVGYTAQL